MLFPLWSQTCSVRLSSALRALTLRAGRMAEPPALRASRCHAADWAHSRVDNSAVYAAKQNLFHRFLVCRHPLCRYLPCAPILRASHDHAAAATQRAASLRLGLGTGPLRVPSVPRPRSGPSALLRTPPRFFLPRVLALLLRQHQLQGLHAHLNHGVVRLKGGKILKPQAGGH